MEQINEAINQSDINEEQQTVTLKPDKVKTKKKVKLNRTQTLILYFFLFAFMGWLMETFYAVFTLGHFVKRGFLFGPICPIYGYGALMLILFLGKYRHEDLKLFVYAAVIFSAFEYVVSYGLDALFAMHWWDYTNEFLNLNGRISILFSIAWGVIAILFINHIYPFLKKKINLILAKIPYIVQINIIRLLCAIYFIDTIVSCVFYLHI